MGSDATAPLQPCPVACTIVARNYLAQAQVLARTFLQHHPSGRFVTLVIDATGDEAEAFEIGSVCRPTELGLDHRTLHDMFTIYDVMELATALKPALLRRLLGDGHAAVAYLDPDTRVYAPFDDVFAQAEAHGIVLTPHVLAEVPRDGLNHDEAMIMNAGMYNLGFLAVGDGAGDFLDWWHRRLITDAIDAVDKGLFTDQRWVDWVPSLFDHTICRDRGMNVAYWNLHERPITRADAEWWVDEAPLRLFHFSGYDPGRPWLLSKHMGDKPRITFSGHPELRQLVDEYRAELVAAGHPALREQPYGLAALPNGSRLDRPLRRAYRDVLLGELAVEDPPPDPFADPDAFVEWLLAPRYEGARATLSVAEVGYWRNHRELRAAFPDLLGAHGRFVQQWLWTEPAARRAFWELAGRPLRPPPEAPVRRPRGQGTSFGWSVFAYARSEHGVGEAGRRLAAAVELSGLPSEVVGVPLPIASRQRHRSVESRRSATYDQAIACVNADQVEYLDATVGLGGFRTRVGMWFWELAEFPTRWRASVERLHEVWVASEFIRDALQRATDRPVRTVRLPIPLQAAPTRFPRAATGLPPDKHVFLVSFDYLSVYQRKNPIGAIEAYKRAFGPDDGAVLVLKSINGSARRPALEHVRSVAAGRSDIRIVDGHVSATVMQAMVELADTYVSLHRAEGYGLSLADAMALRTPVIATGYSGNMDFMTADTAELVKYDLIEVGPGCDPYAPSAVWADPDLDHAAAAMRRVFDDRTYATKLADRAQAAIAADFSAERVGREMAALLMEVSV